MSYWQEDIQIGNLKFPRFIGGPLDGITDSPFRKLVRDFSKKELHYTEMRHVNMIAHDKEGWRTLKFCQSERPLNYQVAANSVDNIARACEKILEAGVDIVDLNIGCPARNVVGSGSGCALMQDPERLKIILQAFRASLPIPFTVKIRAGFKEKNAVEIAQLIQDCGADALAIHPRLRAELFAGQPDYDLARRVKEAVSIPVIFSGGVVNFKLAQMVYERTGVDGYLISRGIWGRPWKLFELQEAAEGRIYRPSVEVIRHIALAHFDTMLDYYGSRAVYMFRKHLPFYLKGIQDASTLRREIMNQSDPHIIKSQLLQAWG